MGTLLFTESTALEGQAEHRDAPERARSSATPPSTPVPRLRTSAARDQEEDEYQAFQTPRGDVDAISAAKEESKRRRQEWDEGIASPSASPVPHPSADPIDSSGAVARGIAPGKVAIGAAVVPETAREGGAQGAGGGEERAAGEDVTERSAGEHDELEGGDCAALSVTYEALDPAHPRFEDKESTVSIELSGVHVEAHRPTIAVGLACLDVVLAALSTGMSRGDMRMRGQSETSDPAGPGAGATGEREEERAGEGPRESEGAEGEAQEGGSAFVAERVALPEWMVKRSAVYVSLKMPSGTVCLRHEGRGARPVATVSIVGWHFVTDIR